MGFARATVAMAHVHVLFFVAAARTLRVALVAATTVDDVGEIRFPARMRFKLLLTCALAFAGCGGGGAAAKAPATADVPLTPKATETEPKRESAAKEESKPAEDDAAIPTKCAKTDPCVPALAYVKKLCAASYPSVALSLFRGGTPWVRGYVATRRTAAVNASGGVSGEGFLEFDEEVLVLQKRKGDYGGMQVSGASGGGGFYVLRWDGTCNDLDAGELTFNKPPAPKSAKIEWRFLDENTQEALRNDAELNTLANSRRSECKGASSGVVSKKCVDLDKKLTDAVAKAVRRGIELPAPARRP